MGREAKILLGLLGLLAGIFCGVLSMKLFVHRPPAGAGPDVPASFAGDGPGLPLAATTPGGFVLPASAFAGAPPLSPATAVGSDGDGGDDAVPAVIAVRFDAVAEREQVGSVQRFPRGRSDDYEPGQESVAARSSDEADKGEASSGRSPGQVAPVLGREPPVGPSGDGATVFPNSETAVAGVYDVRPGDSWWSVAERAYGDGRFYRALFAWNRSVDSRVSLAPGTRLDIPPRARLMTAWPRLMPH